MEAQGFKEEGSPVTGDTWASRRPSLRPPTSLDAQASGKTPLPSGSPASAALLPLSCSIPEITQPSSPHHTPLGPKAVKRALGSRSRPSPRKVSQFPSSRETAKSIKLHTSSYQQEKQLQASFQQGF